MSATTSSGESLQRRGLGAQPFKNRLPVVLLRVEVDYDVGRLDDDTNIRWRVPPKVLLEEGVCAVEEFELLPTAQFRLFAALLLRAREELGARIETEVQPLVYP